MVRTKLETSRGSRNSSCATRSDVGRVALEDDVPNAVHMASEIFRKKTIGDMRAKTRRARGYTAASWISSPRRTTPMNPASGGTSERPSRAVMPNTRHATP